MGERGKGGAAEDPAVNEAAEALEQAVDKAKAEEQAATKTVESEVAAAREQVEAALKNFESLKQSIPNLQKVISDMQQQQADVTQASSQINQSAQSVLRDVDEAVQRVNTSVQGEIQSMLKDLPNLQGEAVEQGPARMRGQAAAPSGGEPAGGGQQFNASGAQPQLSVAEQVADALRRIIRNEVHQAVSEQIAPLVAEVNKFISSKSNL